MYAHVDAQGRVLHVLSVTNRAPWLNRPWWWLTWTRHSTEYLVDRTRVYEVASDYAEAAIVREPQP